MKTKVKNITPGEAINYHGNPCIVLEHREDGALLLAVRQIEYKFGSTNNFADSDLRMHLNGNYLESLTEGHPDEIITRTVDLTALNGSKEYGTCECKVAPLTLDELRKYHGIIPKPETFEWSSTSWSTPCVDEDDSWVLGLHSDGGINGGGYSYTRGCRPAFLIPSDFAVEEEGNPLEQYSTRELAEEIAQRLAAGNESHEAQDKP